MANGNRTVGVILAGVCGFVIPAMLLYTSSGPGPGEFLELVFGGSSLCIATTLAASTIAWLFTAQPGTRRRNGGLLGVLLGLAAGFGAIAWLVYTPWQTSTIDDKLIAGIIALPGATMVGFLIGYFIARGAPRALPVPSRRLVDHGGPRYTP